MKNALSIKGGGIRGIIPCCYLIELEKQLGKSVRECFSFIAGTSTGSDLCALIQAGVPMTTALTFYTGQDAKKVFSPSAPEIAWPKRVIDGYIYDPKMLAECLRSALGPYVNWTINDCPNGVLIIGVDSDGHTWFFAKDNQWNSSKTGTCSLVDAVVGSSAAPTYFDFWPMEISGRQVWMADGGTAGFANPVYRMAIEMFEYGAANAADTRIISLGTGYYPSVPSPARPQKGIIARIGYATSTLVNSSEDLADQDTQRVYYKGREAQFIKLDPALPSAIDEANLSAVPSLLAIGQAAAALVDWKQILGL
jgi:hypothetical protein